MGGLHSKLKSTSTPFKNLNELESEDPRSPNVFFRTPISKVSSSNKRSYDMCPRNLLKSKLQDAVDNNMVDPRSPSSFIVRTPICLKNSLTKTSDNNQDDAVLNHNQLDDNVADNDNDASIADNENACDISTVTEISTIDPRSPSLNIDRTPFFFTSNKTINVNDNADDNDKESTIIDTINTATDDEKLQTLSKMMIFEDDNENNYSTPPKKICEKKSMLITADGENKQRTPLSCLGNRKNSKFSMRNNLESFSGFSKGNKHSDGNVSGINDFNKEKVF